MGNFIRVLSLILAAQLVLTALTSGVFESESEDSLKAKLFDFSFEKVDKITIVQRKEGEGQTERVLLRSEEGWRLPGYFDFPVDEKKLDLFRDEILSVQPSFAVGNTMIAAKKFEVGDENFQRKVSFSDGDNPLGSLYVGTSPSFRKVHVRVDGETKTYAIELNAFNLDREEDAWADKDLLAFDKSQIRSITVGDFTLQKNEAGEFVTPDLAADEEMVPGKATALVNRAAKPRFEKVLGTEEKDEYNLETPVVTYEVTTGDEKTTRFTFGSGPGEEGYVLKASSHPYFFSVAEFQVKPFVELNPEEFVQAKESDPEEAKDGEKGEEEAGSAAE